MPNFFIGYTGGSRPASPEEGAKHMEKYKAWYMGLGDAIVSPDTPLMHSKSVTSSGVQDAGSDRIVGFCVIKAENLDAAVEVAKASPFLDMDNTKIQVSETMQM